MRYDPRIHSKAHLVKAVMGGSELLLGGPRFPAGELVVVNYHGTQKKFIPDFKKQLDFFRSRFEIVSPATVTDYYYNNAKLDRPSLLFTFDDGISNNLYAAEALAKHAIKAYFFIVPAFIDTPAPDQKEYFTRHIRPSINPAIDAAEEDFRALSWNELKDLRKDGHVIGSHTFTHTLISSEASARQRTHEIVDSRVAIAESLGIPREAIIAYCSINNTLQSTGQAEAALIAEHYRLHFTTLPGSNSQDKNPYFIKRSNVEAHWLKGALANAIGTWDRGRWKNRIEQYRKTIAAAEAPEIH